MARIATGWSMRSIPGDVEVLIDLPADVTFSRTQDQPGLKEAGIIVSGQAPKVIADLEKLHATIGECLSYLNRREGEKPLEVGDRVIVTENLLNRFEWRAPWPDIVGLHGTVVHLGLPNRHGCVVRLDNGPTVGLRARGDLKREED